MQHNKVEANTVQNNNAGEKKEEPCQQKNVLLGFFVFNKKENLEKEQFHRVEKKSDRGVNPYKPYHFSIKALICFCAKGHFFCESTGTLF